MKRLLILLALTLVVGLCSSWAAAEETVIGVSFDFVSNPIRQAEVNAIKEAAKEAGVEVIILAAELDGQRQVSQVEDLITKEVDALIILPHDKQMIVSAIRKANRAGIPVVTIDREAGSGGQVAYHVGGGPYSDGRDVAQYLAYTAAATGKTFKVLELIGSLADENAIGRDEGFMDVVSNWPEDVIEVVSRVPTEWKLEKALDGTINALQAHPEINAIYTPSDYLGPAVISALEVTGRLAKIGDPDHVVIIGIDGNDYAWKQMAEGYWDADVATLADELGKRALEAAVKLARGEELPVKKDVVPGLLFTPANMEHVKDQIWGADSN